MDDSSQTDKLELRFYLHPETAQRERERERMGVSWLTIQGGGVDLEDNCQYYEVFSLCSLKFAFCHMFPPKAVNFFLKLKNILKMIFWRFF